MLLHCLVGERGPAWSDSRKDRQLSKNCVDCDVNVLVVCCYRIMKQMPSGRAFLCLHTKELPSIMQQIFTSTMLSTR